MWWYTAGAPVTGYFQILDRCIHSHIVLIMDNCRNISNTVINIHHHYKDEWWIWGVISIVLLVLIILGILLMTAFKLGKNMRRNEGSRNKEDDKREEPIYEELEEL